MDECSRTMRESTLDELIESLPRPVGATEPTHRAAKELVALRAETDRLQRPVKCKVREAGGDPPQDCDWPHCGCDPKAAVVLDAIHEEGYLAPTEAAKLRGKLGAAVRAATSLRELVDLALGYLDTLDAWDRDAEIGAAMRALEEALVITPAADEPSEFPTLCEIAAGTGLRGDDDAPSRPPCPDCREGNGGAP